MSRDKCIIEKDNHDFVDLETYLLVALSMLKDLVIENGIIFFRNKSI
jgi:hypothetical protein